MPAKPAGGGAQQICQSTWSLCDVCQGKLAPSCIGRSSSVRPATTVHSRFAHSDRSPSDYQVFGLKDHSRPAVRVVPETSWLIHDPLVPGVRLGVSRVLVGNRTHANLPGAHFPERSVLKASTPDQSAHRKLMIFRSRIGPQQGN
jgi:hypothetical protein